MNSKTKKKRDHSGAAADVLSDLAKLADGKPGLPEAPIPDDGKPSLPEPDPITPADGKPGLPEPEPEDDLEPYEEDAEGEDEQDAEEKEVTFTEKDRKDLPLLEKRVEGKLREAAQAIREIRQRQLWRLCEDDQGQRVNYPNFEAYCQDHLGHSRQWVTHLTNWLRIMEELDRLKFPVPHLTVKAAQGLLIGRLQDAGGLRAVLEEAKDDGAPLDRDSLREIVLRRADFNFWSKDGKEGFTKPAAKNYAEFKKDLALVKELGEDRTDYGIIAKAKELEGDLGDNLVSLCQQERKMPKPDSLLAMLTGKTLEDVVSRLKDVGKEFADIEEKKNLLKTRRKQLKEMLQEEGLKKIREEAKTLEQELQAKGVLPPKKKPIPPTPQGGSASPQPVAPQEDEENDEDNVEPDSEVYTNLTTAREYLDEALLCDWSDEDGGLNAILLVAEDCETKLAEITAKVKELIADTEQPEAVLGGND